MNFSFLRKTPVEQYSPCKDTKSMKDMASKETVEPRSGLGSETGKHGNKTLIKV